MRARLLRLAGALLAAVVLAPAAAADAPAPLSPVAEATPALVAARVVRARTVLAPADLAWGEAPVAGAVTDPADAVGMEARVTLYAGRPIRPEDLGPPALVERNQIVTLSFAAGRLRMLAEGRALDRGGLGERVRVMNLDSRLVVTGRVSGHEAVEVGK